MRRPSVRRTLGVPRGSGLPNARSAARRAVGIQRPKPRRKPASESDSTTNGGPYDDPSRDVGEGPDGLTRMQSVLVSLALLFGIYVASASCGTADLPPVQHECHICQEFTSGGGE